MKRRTMNDESTTDPGDDDHDNQSPSTSCLRSLPALSDFEGEEDDNGGNVITLEMYRCSSNEHHPQLNESVPSLGDWGKFLCELGQKICQSHIAKTTSISHFFFCSRKAHKTWPLKSQQDVGAFSKNRLSKEK